jgi:addiction module RelE/StbE family toxin
MAGLNWTDQAIQDLENIREYIAKDSKKYSIVQINRIRDRTRLLKHQQKMGRIVPEVGRVDIRELILGNYRIIYKIVDKDRIDILTIHHSAKILRLEA